ncbi:MAG: hypothetical protein AAF602_19795 [Myxococcota bacterium]
MRHVHRVLPALVFLGACPAGDPCAGTEGVAPSLVLGEGPDGFQRALEVGYTLRAEFGPQGGYHVWPAVRTTGFAPGTPGRGLGSDRNAPTFTASLFEELIPIESVETTLAMEGDGAAAELVLFRLPLAIDLGDERPFRLEVTGSDVCGTTVSAAQEVLIGLER